MMQYNPSECCNSKLRIELSRTATAKIRELGNHGVYVPKLVRAWSLGA